MADTKKQVALNINLDQTPILYTENIYMSTSEDGLTLDIAQKLVGTNQQRIVARVGMSREHAKKFLKELGNLLAITEGHVQTGDERKN
jgi:hypothetical protein